MAMCETRGWLVLKLLCILRVCWYIYLCICTYYMRNNYVKCIVAMHATLL